MGRMTKQGIDYFSLDCQFDDKTELYLLEHEATGLAVLVTLWQLIYSNEGYYIKNNKDLNLLIKKRINVDINTIDVYINTMIKREIFDSKLHEQYGILTSRAIQKRYFDAAKRKKEVKIISEFTLIDINTYINLINVDINGVNVRSNATKEKEEEKEKEKEKGEERNVIDDTITTWNFFAKEYNLPTVMKITESRVKHINQRLKEKDFDLIKILREAEKSDFLLGKKNDWKIDFDFIFASKNNYIKILEGKYRNSTNGRQKTIANDADAFREFREETARKLREAKLN